MRSVAKNNGLTSMTLFASLSLSALAIVALSLVPATFAEHHYPSPLFIPTTPALITSSKESTFQLDRRHGARSPPPPPDPNFNQKPEPRPPYSKPPRSKPPPPPPPPPIQPKMSPRPFSASPPLSF